MPDPSRSRSGARGRSSAPRIVSLTLSFLALALALGIGFGLGYLARGRGGQASEAARRLGEFLRPSSVQLPRAEQPPGLWSPVRDSGRDAVEEIYWTRLTEEQRRSVLRLRSLAYAAGYETAEHPAGVTVHLREAAAGGLNLYNSGHAPEAVLMDMDGEVLHRWSHDFRDAFAEPREATGDRTGMDYWRRVHLYPNGDLLAIYEGFGLIRIDRDSNLIWATPGGYHHDVFVSEEGRIYALSREVRIIPRLHPRHPLLVDSIEVLEADGTPLKSVPLLEAFEGSSYAPLLKQSPAYLDPEYGDMMHSNTIEVLDGSLADRSPAFRKGNILVSVLEMNAIVIVDPEKGRVVWALSGQWHRQHQPTFLDSGNLLLFDNLGHGGMSRVIEIDPFTQQLIWSYEGSAERPFSTLVSGSNQRLANGNTLITESDTGRAFEVTAGGRIVWEFHNGARAGPDDELVAMLCEVIRLDPDIGMEWLVRGERAN